MARMRDFEAEAEAAIGKTWGEISRPFHRNDQAARIRVASQQPATTPGMIGTATAAPETGGTMSIATLEADLGNGVAAVKAKVAEFEQALPGIVADVRKVTGSPLGQLAVAAAEHVAAGVLPPEALAIVESGAQKLYADILGLYSPQNAPAPATAQAAQPTQPATAAQ